MIRVNVWEARAAGTFNFSAGMTQGPNPNTASSTAGNALASLLLGTGTQGNALIQNWKNVASQNFYFGGYVQDDWRVTSRLTLNLGLRYDYETPRTERYDRMNYFDPVGASPLAAVVPQYPNLRGGLVFVGVDGNSRWQFEPDRNNISPRVGGAFEINDKTVLRGGYAHVYGAVVPAGQRHRRPVRVPDREPVGLVARRHHAVPAAPRSLSGWVHALARFERRPAHRRRAAPFRRRCATRSPTPWNRQWNVTLQRELPWRVAVEVAYVGTAGHDLSTNTEGGLSLNQLDPQHMALGSALNQLVPNPFFGIVNNGVLVSQQVSRAQLAAPVPAVHRHHPAAEHRRRRRSTTRCRSA